MSRTILVVEEHPSLRERYAEVLRSEGFEVVSAPPTEDAHRLISEAAPDVIVLDPDCAGGKGMAIALEALGTNPSISLVFNTSHPINMETDFSTWVADAYAVRSHSPEHVSAAVRRLIPGPERAARRRRGISRRQALSRA
ncbi:MAG: response regulator [Candidatus Eisenbacteria sp.]|nr:response regulator [Candidatus Eisenbacteria bacterium]